MDLHRWGEEHVRLGLDWIVSLGLQRGFVSYTKLLLLFAVAPVLVLTLLVHLSRKTNLLRICGIFFFTLTTVVIVGGLQIHLFTEGLREYNRSKPPPLATHCPFP